MAWFGLFKSNVEKAMEAEEQKYINQVVAATKRMKELEFEFLDKCSFPINLLTLNDAQKSDLMRMAQQHRAALRGYAYAESHLTADVLAWQSRMDQAHWVATGRTPRDLEKEWKLEVAADLALFERRDVENAAKGKVLEMHRSRPVFQKVA